MQNPFFWLRSTYNSLFYALRRKVRWSRPHYMEIPAGQFTDLPDARRQRIEELKSVHRFIFEEHLNGMNALENYNFLDVFDLAAKKFGWKPKVGQVHVDVGSKNFYYARVLHDYFKPQKLTGIELDGYRVYEDFHSRADYAKFYIRSLPNTEYHVMDFCEYEGKADMITLFYPFVVIEPLLEWSLPLKEFKPEMIFRKVFEVLSAGGQILMINHGWEEYDAAKPLAKKCGLNYVDHFVHEKPLLKRGEIPIVSLWKKP